MNDKDKMDQMVFQIQLMRPKIVLIRRAILGLLNEDMEPAWHNEIHALGKSMEDLWNDSHMALQAAQLPSETQDDLLH